MWNTIVEWDRATFVAINSGMQSPFLDAVMPPISDLGLGHVQLLAVVLAAIVMRLVKRDDLPWEPLRVARVWLIEGRTWLAVYLVAVLLAGLAVGKGWFPPVALAAAPFAVAIGLSLIGRRRQWVAPLLAAWALSGIGSTVIKNSMVRDRPSWFYRHEHAGGRHLDVQVHVIEGRRPLRVRGFLSGHTATSIALATAFTLVALRRKWVRGLAAVSWTIALLVSFSRVYTADHWPLDVVGGAALGVMCGFVGVGLCRRYEERGATTSQNSDSDDGIIVERVAGSV